MKIANLIGHLCFKVLLITSEVWVACFELLITLIRRYNQIITISLSGNHEYNTRSEDNINADQPALLSALSRA